MLPWLNNLKDAPLEPSLNDIPVAQNEMRMLEKNMSVNPHLKSLFPA